MLPQEILTDKIRLYVSNGQQENVPYFPLDILFKLHTINAIIT